jgi:hypothetical protein
MADKKVVTPKAKAPKKVDPKEALATLGNEIFCGHSGMIAVKAEFTAVTIQGGEIVEVPMGSLQAPPRNNKPKADGTFSKGFYLNGKLLDPTMLGQASGTKFQVGVHVTAVNSKTW